MKRPSFQFYPGDWAANPNLKRCTFAERGIWVEVMCLMHDQEQYGVLRWPLKEIAQAIGCKPSELQALVRKGVLKGADDTLTEPFVYVPRSGRKDGEPVTLIAPQAGPIWYSSRMVKDEHVRTIRGEGSGSGDSPKGTPKTPPHQSPKPPIGETFGPRDSSSSSSASAVDTPAIAGGGASPSAPAPQHPPGSTGEGAEQPALTLVSPAPPPPRLPDCPHLDVLRLWAEVLPAMPQHEPDQWRGARADHLRARWRETAKAKGWATSADGLLYLRKLFAYVGQSRFLTGLDHSPNRRPFFVTLAWLCEPTHWAEVIEGKYHAEAA